MLFNGTNKQEKINWLNILIYYPQNKHCLSIAAVNQHINHIIKVYNVTVYLKLFLTVKQWRLKARMFDFWLGDRKLRSKPIKSIWFKIPNLQIFQRQVQVGSNIDKNVKQNCPLSTVDFSTKLIIFFVSRICFSDVQLKVM